MSITTIKVVYTSRDINIYIYIYIKNLIRENYKYRVVKSIFYNAHFNEKSFSILQQHLVGYLNIICFLFFLLW